MAEDKEKITDARDDVQDLHTAITDMLKDVVEKISATNNRMDTMSSDMSGIKSRMDAVEDRTANRDARRDDEGDDEEPDAPPETLADKSRKDKGRRDSDTSESRDQGEDAVEDRKGGRRSDAQEDEREGERKDTRRSTRKDERTGARRDEDDDEDGAVGDASVRAELAALRAEIADLNRRAPAMLSNVDREKFATIQEGAEPAFQAFGDRAPAPLEGETTAQYKRRLGSRLQVHSPRMKTVRLVDINDDTALDLLLGEIFADSMATAQRGMDVPAGILREVRTTTPAGHTAIEFRGEPDSWMKAFTHGAIQRGSSRHASA